MKRINQLFVSPAIVASLFISIISVLPSQALAATVFLDDFNQSGDNLTNKWTVISGADNPQNNTNSRVSTSDDSWTDVEVAGNGLLLEGDNSSNPDEGAERSISTYGYSSITVQYSRAINSFEAGDQFKVEYTLDNGSAVSLETLTANQSHSLSPLFTISNPDRKTKLTLKFYVNGTDDTDEAAIDNLNIEGDNTPLFYDGFESGNFTVGGWTTSESPTIQTEDDDAWTDNNTATPEGRSANIDGSNGTNPDDAIEKSYDTTGYENIKIRYARKVDDLSSGESFKALYTVNGSTWIDLEIPFDNSAYLSKLVSLPSSANNNPNFKIRFEMNAGSPSDNSFVDDVIIWGDQLLTTGSLTVTKNTIGGNGTFSFTGGAGSFDITTTGGMGSITRTDLTPGSVTVTETVPSGWSKTGDTCTSVTITAGNTAICTITNTKYTVITGIKYEDMDGNGQKDVGEPGKPNVEVELRKVIHENTPLNIPIDTEMLALQLTGTNGQFNFNTTETGHLIVKENTPAGWQPTFPADSFFDIFVEIPGQQINQGSVGHLGVPFVPITLQVPLQFGNFKLITVTVKKDVVAPDGETNVNDSHQFNVTLDGQNQQLISDAINEGLEALYGDVGPGPHTLAEIGDPDFDLLRISHNGNTLDSGVFIPESGQDMTIVVTNRQKQGSLTVNKIVNNPNSGTAVARDFFFKLNSGEAIQFIQNEINALLGINNLTVDPGSYTITEILPRGAYAISYNNCEVTVASNGKQSNDTTCTITNSDIPKGQGAITVIKNVVNDSGGTLDAESFSLFINQEEEDPLSTMNGEAKFLDPGNYTVSEDELPKGYTQTSIGCTNGETTTNDGSVALGEQDSWICTITNNDDEKPVVTVTADNQSKIYGADDPALTYTSIPVVDFTGSLQRVSGENVGTYSINQGNLSAGDNYVTNFNPGILTIRIGPASTEVILETTSNGDGSLSGTVPTDTETSTTINNTSVTLDIPAGTIITGPASWDRIFKLPTAGSSGGTAPAGFSVGNLIIEIGSNNSTLLLNNPAVITLAEVTGPVAYRTAGSSEWTQITNTCAGTYAIPQNPTSPGECAISDGINTKIVTYHFTSFASLNRRSHHGRFISVIPATSIASAKSPAVPTISSTPATSALEVAQATPPVGQVLGVETFKFLIDMKLGSKINDVTELQKRLVEEVFYKGPITRYFGKLTKTAVKKYQTKKGIRPDGVVGSITRSFLNGE